MLIFSITAILLLMPLLVLITWINLPISIYDCTMRLQLPLEYIVVPHLDLKWNLDL